MFLSHINICISISMLSFKVWFLLPTTASVLLPLTLLTSRTARGRHRNKNHIVLVRPSVQKRKMFNVYFYTDISLAAALCALRLGQLWTVPGEASAQDRALSAAAPSAPAQRERQTRGCQGVLQMSVCLREPSTESSEIILGRQAAPKRDQTTQTSFTPRYWTQPIACHVIYWYLFFGFGFFLYFLRQHVR